MVGKKFIKTIIVSFFQNIASAFGRITPFYISNDDFYGIKKNKKM